MSQFAFFSKDFIGNDFKVFNMQWCAYIQQWFVLSQVHKYLPEEDTDGVASLFLGIQVNHIPIKIHIYPGSSSQSPEEAHLLTCIKYNPCDNCFDEFI
jgi:hypothetical protein